ncbi:hypothetical protein [Caballeronia catudaia]|nr:hypothetical protein [Caballeronia catudaia]
MFDLEPADAYPLPFAVPFHAHEYVHFLHNASTTAGQAYLVANLILLRALAAGANDCGHFLGGEALEAEQLDWLRLAGAVMRTQLGATSAREMQNCTDIRTWECGAPELVEGGLVDTIHATFTAREASGEQKSECFAIGLSFITEGVAYEIDREMRRLGGQPVDSLDAATKAFPYLAYRVLVRSWSGRDLSAKDYIAIGVSALHCNVAGFGLSEICRFLKASTASVDQVLNHVRPQWNQASTKVLDDIRTQRTDLSQGDVIWTAMGEYMKLAEAGAQLRRSRWAPELDFLSGTMTTDGFKRAVSTMLDCLVIQSKPEGRFDMYWHGPNVVARTDQTIQCLGALQSALHFSQLHLGQDGSAYATDTLPATACPFSGGCGVEASEGFPSDCKSFPWRRASGLDAGKKVCWYAAGVKALRSSSRR